jgi:citrate synthase
VANVDQRRINNQPSGYVSAAKAAQLLDVKRQTLYAYTSRGLLRSIAVPGGRARRYALEDLRRLKARSDARRGHAAVASGALDWGAPVLDSAITRIDDDGPHYRGHSALAFARAGASFERVAEQLWGQGADAERAIAEPVRDALAPAVQRRLLRALPETTGPLSRLAALVLLAGVYDLDRHTLQPRAELARARLLLRAMAVALAPPSRLHAEPVAQQRARIAELAAGALGAGASARTLRSLDQMLSLCADHELNVSTFAVRVTASSGADLYACVGAGLCALSGPWHGGMCDRVEALAQRCRKPAEARELVRELARLGEYIPGFGHPLYPKGDPRALFLLARAYALGAGLPQLKTMRAIADVMAQVAQLQPTLDFGLVALSMALELPAGSAAAIFALGRTAGWVAHALEQRESKVLLRPRARYVGSELT